ncbi:MAG TPA: hypothetical protein VF587_15335 [Solirubrobacteraceae bacterium]|jgi:hypothetical protein
MTRAMVSPEDVGRSCPYCRFPLKEGMEAERCDACGALHHEDCWRDCQGCAVVGCVGGQSAAPVGDLAAVSGQAPATAVMPAAGVEHAAPAAKAPLVPPPPPSAAPPAPAGGGGGNRSLVLGLVGGLAIAAAGVGGFALAGSGGDEKPAPSRPAAETVAQPPATPPSEDVEPVAPTEAEIAERIQAIVAFSLEGRTAVIQGRYQDAIDNRERVLRRLDGIDGATGRVARARRVLRQAMEASLESDRHYANGTDASGTDAEATRLKQEFVTVWNPIAREHGLSSYGAGEI